MKLIYLGILILLPLHSFAAQSPKVIYGNDDREDVINVYDNMLVEKSRSTAAMIYGRYLTLQADGKYSIQGRSLFERGWCASERFSNQKASASCSGFLIADDVLVTAGHCVSKTEDCQENVWVFDFKLDKATDETANVPQGSVYRCQSILHTSNTSFPFVNDYAIVRLDRKVLDRSPLEIRKSGKITKGTPVVLMGHPLGLPLKIAAGANVRSTWRWKIFKTNTDSFGGNSGSPVIDARTGIVEGILIGGEKDEVKTSAGCSESFKCSNTGCRGEDVTRITNLPKVYQYLD